MRSYSQKQPKLIASWKLDCFKHSSSKQTRSRLKSESYRGRGDLRLIRQLTSGSCSWATFNFKRVVRLDWLNQSSLRNLGLKIAVTPHFLHFSDDIGGSKTKPRK